MDLAALLVLSHLLKAVFSQQQLQINSQQVPQYSAVELQLHLSLWVLLYSEVQLLHHHLEAVFLISLLNQEEVFLANPSLGPPREVFLGLKAQRPHKPRSHLSFLNSSI